MESKDSSVNVKSPSITECTRTRELIGIIFEEEGQKWERNNNGEISRVELSWFDVNTKNTISTRRADNVSRRIMIQRYSQLYDDISEYRSRCYSSCKVQFLHGGWRRGRRELIGYFLKRYGT